MDIDEFVALSVKHNASDLHLCAGHPPMLRIDGELQPLAAASTLTAQGVQALCDGLLSAQQREPAAAGADRSGAAQAGWGAAASQRFSAKRGDVSRIAPHRRAGAFACRAGGAGHRPGAAAARRRASSGHRRHRQRQVHHAGGDDRRDQPAPAAAHFDAGGSDRIPAP